MKHRYPNNSLITYSPIKAHTRALLAILLLNRISIPLRNKNGNTPPIEIREDIYAG